MRGIISFQSESKILQEIIRLCTHETIVLAKNSHGNFTPNGLDPKPSEKIEWDVYCIPRMIISIDEHGHETSRYTEGGKDYLLKINLLTGQLFEIYRMVSSDDLVCLNSIAFDINSPLIRALKGTSLSSMRQTIDEPVVFRRNEAGKFTADGKNVIAEWDYIYFDGVTLGRNDIDNLMYAYCNVRGIGNVALTFTRDTSELICVHNSDHGERVDEFTVYRNSSIFRNYKELGPLNMAKVVPYTSIELSSTGLSINGKHETPDRQYMWSINKVNGMEVVLNGTIDVKVPEAAPPVTITINAQGKIQKIKDTNGNNRVDVKIPNDDEFLKHLRVSLEISHLSDIKE